MRTGWIFPTCLVATVIVAAAVLHWQIERRLVFRVPNNAPTPTAMGMGGGGRMGMWRDPKEYFQALAPKLNLTPEQKASIEASIDESRRQGAYPSESFRQAALHLTEKQRALLEEYRDSVRAAVEERSRARDEELARGIWPDQYLRFSERHYDRVRSVAAARPR